MSMFRLVVVFFICFSAFPAHALVDPEYDIPAYCRKAVAYLRSPLLEPYCLQTEENARERLLALEALPTPESAACAEKSESYTQWETCLRQAAEEAASVEGQ